MAETNIKENQIRLAEKMTLHHAFITGPTGAVGTAVIRMLLDQGASVTAVIRPGSPLIKNLPDSPALHRIECDLEDLPDFCAAVNRVKDSPSPSEGGSAGSPSEDDSLVTPPDFDAFFHLGWTGTYGASRNDRASQQKNVRMTLDAVRLADALGCKVFVFAGSQSEFGPVDGPIVPDTPCHPDNAYGEAKLDAEMTARELCRQFGIRFISCRIFSTYGPCDKEYTMVMSTLLKMERGERLAFTKGEQHWNYLYSDDTARALIAAAEKGSDGAVYLVASDRGELLKDYITKMRDIVSPDAELHFGEIPYFDHQVMRMEPDISSLTADTGFVPRIPFEEGIRRTIDWIRAQD